MYIKTCLEWQCQHHKNVAGQSIWEIGRRLNHVKENDLVHGEFMEWVEKIGIKHSEALRMMKASKELPNSSTLANLGQRGEWVENKISINRREAYKFMKVAKELPNVATLQHLPST
ncbi:DUF3102 domain-containing protein [Streptococcus uberis]|uniref:DUF3102 domain-containing protein n=1 Tax=Streptococcus uberis TaxID=1349 RepID=UPI0020BEFB52|nr:DUF3102 domain-containing protein [Streptococcus uberis]